MNILMRMNIRRQQGTYRNGEYVDNLVHIRVDGEELEQPNIPTKSGTISMQIPGTEQA